MLGAFDKKERPVPWNFVLSGWVLQVCVIPIPTTHSISTNTKNKTKPPTIAVIPHLSHHMHTHILILIKHVRSSVPLFKRQETGRYTALFVRIGLWHQNILRDRQILQTEKAVIAFKSALSYARCITVCIFAVKMEILWFPIHNCCRLVRYLLSVL